MCERADTSRLRPYRPEGGRERNRVKRLLWCFPCVCLLSCQQPSFTPPVRVTVGKVRYSIEINVGGGERVNFTNPDVEENFGLHPGTQNQLFISCKSGRHIM